MLLSLHYVKGETPMQFVNLLDKICNIASAQKWKRSHACESEQP